MLHGGWLAVIERLRQAESGLGMSLPEARVQLHRYQGDDDMQAQALRSHLQCTGQEHKYKRLMSLQSKRDELVEALGKKKKRRAMNLKARLGELLWEHTDRLKQAQAELSDSKLSSHLAQLWSQITNPPDWQLPSLPPHLGLADYGEDEPVSPIQAGLLKLAELAAMIKAGEVIKEQALAQLCFKDTAQRADEQVEWAKEELKRLVENYQQAQTHISNRLASLNAKLGEIQTIRLDQPEAWLRGCKEAMRQVGEYKGEEASSIPRFPRPSLIEAKLETIREQANAMANSHPLLDTKRLLLHYQSLQAALEAEEHSLKLHLDQTMATQRDLQAKLTRLSHD